MRDDERAANIVQFWRTVEMFSPQQVPRRANGEPGGRDQVLDLDPEELAPWESGHPLTSDRLPPDKTRIFTVYGGLYDVTDVRHELERVFGEDTKPPDGRSYGQTAMFAFTVSADGHVVENSATLSACAWALHRMYTAGPADPRWLDGFTSDERAFCAALDKLSPPKLARDDSGAETTASFGARVGEAVTERVRSAARDAVEAGAKATGTAVNVAVAGVGSALAGPVVGGIAGQVAGTFVEKLISPGSSDSAMSTPNEQQAPRAPRFNLTAVTLHEFVKDLADALGIAVPLQVAGVRIECTVISVKSADKPNQQAFLNSFIAEDLAQIEQEVRRGRAGDALAAYLTSGSAIPAANRVDVRAERSTLIDGVDPRRAPGGRWPAATDRSLVVSQQFAVNQILEELGSKGGLFSVNGPPGTGKTTMLRDVLAGIVVERARRLAELDDPLEAFTDVLEEVPLTPRYRARVRGLRPELTGFEVVLATANNDAAANVTAEMPGMKAVDGVAERALSAEYFPQLASHILDDEAWGLVAAVLGNMNKRGTFAYRFWWSDQIGMRAVLKRVRHSREHVDDWSEAAVRFQQAEQKVAELSIARQHAADAIREVQHWRVEIPKLEQDLAAVRARYQQREAEVAQLDGWSQHAHGTFVATDQEYQNHLRHKPGFWISLSTWFRAGRDWARRHAELAELRDRARQDFDRSQAQLAQARAELTKTEKQWREGNQGLVRANASASAARRRVSDAQTRWPGKIPATAFADEQQFQLCAPWADEEFCTARTDLFLEALRLHKSFLFSTGSYARDNLAVIMEALRRKVQVKPEALQAAWRTLFLVVPMISTTFASLPRLFDGLDREALGWLFIDEAGQATAQQAAGGLWRCRRAVIVGDPQQLEPIVTLPLPAQHALRRHHDVDEEWTPDGTSAQRVADRLARHGAFLPEPNGEDHVWVGSPLRVHRRCDRPMFDISNRIAYGNDLMIYGTTERPDYPGTNAWIDVRSPQSDGNWVPEEGDALQSLLGELAAAGVPAKEIRVISPFRRVVTGSKYSARAKFDWEFVRDNVGTVHTVQGKEADVVVLVLGTGPERARARAWAAEKPNLLNVAASRAKRRLYVIGNLESWQHLPYFSVLAEVLPVRRHIR